MKHFMIIAVLAAMLGVAASAQETKTVSGYLVDKMCASSMVKKSPDEAMARAAKHTRECAMEKDCAAAGYGVVSDGKWIGFDAAGNEKAAAYLKSTHKEDHLLVEVKGTLKGDVLNVTSIREVKSPAKKLPKTTGA
ncbi:MAG: hypothetical protein ACM3Q4_00970 [Acidobacteriota bacterium]